MFHVCTGILILLYVIVCLVACVNVTGVYDCVRCTIPCGCNDSCLACSILPHVLFLVCIVCTCESITSSVSLVPQTPPSEKKKESAQIQES